MPHDVDEKWMRLAIELAQLGQGLVEPNPMVGCVLVRDDREIGRGFHSKFGAEHAEINALHCADGATGATAYVNLEPCCHQGKTGPCTQALLEAKISRVVVAALDPFPAVTGGGARQLREAGVQVEVGMLESEARRMNAPYFKRIRTARPWVIAKWAMTLDGKIATSQGDSQWISSHSSRALVHRLRGRMDAILVGGKTAQRDDPLLTARPAGPRTAARVVFDSHLELSPECQLVRSLDQAPLLLVANESPVERRRLFQSLGCEILEVASSNLNDQIGAALDELGRRNMTNVLLEGGSRLIGSFFDAAQIDEVVVFISPKLIGGATALSPIGGQGIKKIVDAVNLVDVEVQRFDDDVCIRARISRGQQP